MLERCINALYDITKGCSSELSASANTVDQGQRSFYFNRRLFVNLEATNTTRTLVSCFRDTDQWGVTSWCLCSLVKLSATVQLASGDDFNLNLHLLHPVAPQQCSFKILSTKVWLIETELLSTYSLLHWLRPSLPIKRLLGKNSSAMHRLFFFFFYSSLCTSESVWIHCSPKLMRCYSQAS